MLFLTRIIYFFIHKLIYPMRQKLLACALVLSAFAPLQAQFFNPICSIFTITQANGAPGDTVCLDVRANVPAPLISIQFAMEWDAAELELVQPLQFPLGQPALALNASNFNLSNSGTLRFSWFDQAASGVPWIPNDVLFRVCFRVKPGVTGFLPVTFDLDTIPFTLALPYEATVMSPYFFLPQNLVFGGIQSGPPPVFPPKVLMICSEPGHCAGNIPVGSVDLIVEEFGDTLSYQWTGPNGFASTGQDLINVPSGNYLVTITNAAGFTTVAAAEVLPGNDPDCTTATGTPDPAIPSITLSPNPAADFTLVGCPDADLERISLVNAAGRIVRDFPVEPARQARIATSGLPSGLYLVVANVAGGKRRARLVIP